MLQFDLTIEGRQDSIETHVICQLNLIVGNAEYSFCFYLHMKSLTICEWRGGGGGGGGGGVICKPSGSNCNYKQFGHPTSFEIGYDKPRL